MDDADLDMLKFFGSIALEIAIRVAMIIAAHYVFGPGYAPIAAVILLSMQIYYRALAENNERTFRKLYRDERDRRQAAERAVRNGGIT